MLARSMCIICCVVYNVTLLSQTDALYNLDQVDARPYLASCITFKETPIYQSAFHCTELEINGKILSNLNYPSAAYNREIQGEVFVAFTIDTSGALINAEIVQSLGGGCDEHALELVGILGQWKPARSNHQVVATRCTLSIPFYHPELDGNSKSIKKCKLYDADKIETHALDTSYTALVNQREFVDVEQMPSWYTCRGSEKAKETCTGHECNREILRLLRENNKSIPDSIVGTLPYSFVVNVHGTIEDIKVSDWLGEEVQRSISEVLTEMSTNAQYWNAGKHHGEAVAVRYNNALEIKATPSKSNRGKSGDLPKSAKVEEIFKVVETMPRFPGCEDLFLGEKDKKQCATKKMLEFLYKSIRYPAEARKYGIEGSVVVSFRIEKDGYLTHIKVLRGIGGGCDEEAIRIVELMNELPERWTPGKQRGKPVIVQYNLPIRFRLE